MLNIENNIEMILYDLENIIKKKKTPENKIVPAK